MASMCVFIILLLYNNLLLFIFFFPFFFAGSMMNPLGNAAGQIIPVLLVDNLGNGMVNLLYLQLGISLFAAVLVIFFFKDGPEVPISSLAELEQKNLKIAHENHTGAIGNVIIMMKDTNFLKLFFGFGCGLGLFNGVLTLTAQLLQPMGYIDDDAGTAGGIFIGCGLVSSGIYGYIMDQTNGMSE